MGHFFKSDQNTYDNCLSWFNVAIDLKVSVLEKKMSWNSLKDSNLLNCVLTETKKGVENKGLLQIKSWFCFSDFTFLASFAYSLSSSSTASQPSDNDCLPSQVCWNRETIDKCRAEGCEDQDRKIQALSNYLFHAGKFIW